MKNLIRTLIVCVISFPFLGFGQLDPSTQKVKKSWAIGAFGGMPIVFGDVNPDFRAVSYGLNIQKAISNTISLRLHGASGFASGVDRKFANWNMITSNPALNGKNNPLVDFDYPGGYTYWNYKMDFYQASFQMLYSFSATDFRMSESPKSNFFLIFGAGAMLFRTYTDQLDANGNPYDFSAIKSDYEARVIEQNEVKKRVAAMLDRNYETPADGNPMGDARTFQRAFLNHTFVPEWTAGVGVRFKLSSRLDLSLETKLSYSATDLLDGQRWDRVTYGLSANHDVFFMIMLGLNIRLGRTDNIYWFDNPATMHYKMTVENKRKVQLITQDSDGDGVPDIFDKDPHTPPGVAVDAHGVPLDSDGDGIPDYLDDDPFTPKGVAVDERGVPLDSDGDGVPDHLDLEPNTPKGNLVNFQGITIFSAEDRDRMTGTVSAAGFLPAIFFDFDDATLRTEALSALSIVAAALKANPSQRLRIIGFTDNVGNPEYNKKLGERRANAVANYLKLQGVSADRLEIVSKGSTEPLSVVSSRDANRLNRRVQFELISGGKK